MKNTDNKKKHTKKSTYTSKLFRKTFSVAATTALLLPHLFGAGVALAEEAAEDLEVEEVGEELATTAVEEEPAAEESTPEPDAEAPADKPVEKPAEKPVDKPVEKPADKPAEKPAEAPAPKTENVEEKSPEATPPADENTQPAAVDSKDETDDSIQELNHRTETHRIKIDPNGGTMNERYQRFNVEDGESFDLPRRMNLNRPGYKLVGFSVKGELYNRRGHRVRKIDTSTRPYYTPTSNVTLIAIWEKTSGDFDLFIRNREIKAKEYAFTFTNEDGQSIKLPYRGTQGTKAYSWGIGDLPSGTYTLSIEDFKITGANLHGADLEDRNVTVNKDGTLTVRIGYPGNNPDAYADLVVDGEVIPTAFPVGVEVRGLDNKRTNDVKIYVQNEDFTVFEGSFNKYKQWSTKEDLPIGKYTIRLDTPANTYAVINETTTNYAVPTNRRNVFTIDVNEENLGSLSAVYAAFQLEATEFRLGVEVRGLDNKRTDKVKVTVTDGDNEVFAGSYNQYNQWLTAEELPAGKYTITLRTPRGTVAVINDTNQYAVPTDKDNVFTIELNESNLGSSSAIYGAFKLVEQTHTVTIDPNGGTMNEEHQKFEVKKSDTFRLPRDLDLTRPGYNLVGFSVDGELLNRRGRALEEISRSTRPSYKAASDVALTAIWEIRKGDFDLFIQNTEVEAEEYNFKFTNEEGEVFELPSRGQQGTNAYSWGIADLPSGTYTLSIDGFKITRGALYGIHLEDDNLTINEDGTLTVHIGFPEDTPSAYADLVVDGEFITEEPAEPEKTEEPEEPETPEKPEAPKPQAPKPDDVEPSSEKETPVSPEKDDVEVKEDVVVEDVVVRAKDALPKTGIATAPIGLGIVTLLSGLGLAFFSKKRKEDE